MKRFLKITSAFLTILTVLAGCENTKEDIPILESDDRQVQENIFIEQEESQISVGDNLPVSRALAAKMIAMAFNDKNAIATMDQEVAFSDIDENHWDYKYINAAVAQGYMSGTDNNLFLPDQALSLAQAQFLLDKINPENNIKMKLDDTNKDKSISYALWCQLYTQLLEDMAADSDLLTHFGIEEKGLVVLASHGNNPVLPEGNLITDDGPYISEGISGDAYIDMEITVLAKDQEIIGILNVKDMEPVIRNAYIAASTENEITIFCGGAERTYLTVGSYTIGNICDIKISGKTALTINEKETAIRGKLLKSDQHYIELSEGAVLPVSEEFKVYSIQDGPVKWKHLKNIIVGRNMAKFVVENGIIEAAIIDEPVKPESIRVLINNSSFSGTIHEEVTVSSTGGFTMRIGESETQYEPSESIAFTNPEASEQRVFITPRENSRIILKSIERNGENPVYRGDFEIAPYEGGFLIVNEVDMESYLYSVVPSEMPASYGIEALKVQAITARSYAYNQFYGNKYHPYGANVDDSVLSQVYNNTKESEISIRAVDETKGQCLTYQGEVISANFFSTTAGMTANSGEVWANAVTKQFPSQTSAYLQSSKEYDGPDYGDLSVEENAAKFLKDWDLIGFDSNISWFRWHFSMTNEEITASINQNLSASYERDPALLKTLQPDGVFRSRPVQSIGTLINIEVLKRGAGGNVMVMKITGSENTILVSTEYNIRTLLSPQKYIEGGQDIIIKRKDGTQISNYALIPSGFFTMERLTGAEGAILSVNFYGGGNGHGVGMSQNGVKGMIDSGYSFETVLNHYYQNTEINVMY